LETITTKVQTGFIQALHMFTKTLLPLLSTSKVEETTSGFPLHQGLLEMQSLLPNACALTPAAA
jgi:hypothetical protein